MKHRPDEILNAAVDVFDAEGVSVSTAKLASGIGISNGTLFNYFATKQDLIDALYLHLKRELAHAIGAIDQQAPLRDRARQIWRRWAAWATEHPASNRVMQLLRSSRLVSAAAQGQADALLGDVGGVFAEGRASGDFADLPIAYLSASVQGQLELAVSLTMNQAELDAVFESVWRGLTRA